MCFVLLATGTEDLLFACEQGLIIEGCDVFTNSSFFFESEMFVEQKESMVLGISEQLEKTVEPIRTFYSSQLYKFMLVLLILGSVLIYFGVQRDWMLFLRKVFMKIGVVFLLSGLVMRYVVFKGSEGMLTWFSFDAPRIILQLSLDIAFSFFRSVFIVYWWPFILVGGASLALVFGLWSGMIVRWWKGRRRIKYLS